MGKPNIKNGQVFALCVYMRQAGIIFLSLFLGLTANAQTRNFEEQVWDFGEVAHWNNDTAWFHVRNATEKDLIFLPTYYSENFQVIFNNRAAGPGESINLGIIYYSETKGKFNETVPLYINQRGEPVIFRLKGNIRGFNPMAELRCPVVNGDPAENRLEKLITIEVRDIKTDETLLPDEIMVRNRLNQRMSLDRSNLEFEMVALPGSYKVTAAKRGYEDYMAVITLEPYQLHFIVYLEKKEDILPPPVVVEEDEEINNTNRNPGEDEKPLIVVTSGDIHRHNRDTLPASDPHFTESGELSKETYKPNNVIMIVDVSSSMNRGGKIESLRSSFNIMVDAFRPEDQIGIVSMSTNAEVIQVPTGVEEKDSMKARVANMKALGGTNGGAAIQAAYQLARDHFIEGGNNQIIIATDGVFYGGTLTRQQIEALIVSGKQEGIHFSSVAFGSDPKAMMFLENLSTKGGGSFIQIQNSAEGDSLLLEMIKSQSRRY